MTGGALSRWLERIERLHPRTIELGLERVHAVASRLDLAAPGCRTVTVAGTNGKGTTASLIAASLHAAGHGVGLYTSPHLYRYNERIRINGQTVTDDALCQAFEAVDAAREGVALTYFEFGTLAALWLFRRAGVQSQVLEVGLGGRLDAVNLVDADLAVITNIGLDHTDWLGETLEAIAAEKAGILRAGRPAVCGSDSMPNAVLDRARELGCPLRLRGRDFAPQPGEDGSWTYRGVDRCWSGLPTLGGPSWVDNAASAAAALEVLGEPSDPEPFRHALLNERLPGRCERRGDLLLDVSHNAEGAAALALTLGSLDLPRPRIAILGMLADKPATAYVQALADAVDEFVLVGLDLSLIHI